MKILSLLISSLGLFDSMASARVIVTTTGLIIDGILEGDGTLLEPLGETIDYLTFEIATSGPIRLIGNDIGSSIFLAMGQVLGGGEPFDVAGFPYRVFDTPTAPPELTLVLAPGIYVVQIANETYRDGDLGPTFIPAENSDDTITIPSEYSFSLEGQFQALDFMEGNLNRTFTVTHIPEPSTTALLGMAAATGFIGRRKRR